MGISANNPNPPASSSSGSSRTTARSNLGNSIVKAIGAQSRGEAEAPTETTTSSEPELNNQQISKSEDLYRLLLETEERHAEYFASHEDPTAELELKYAELDAQAQQDFFRFQQQQQWIGLFAGLGQGLAQAVGAIVKGLKGGNKGGGNRSAGGGCPGCQRSAVASNSQQATDAWSQGGASPSGLPPYQSPSQASFSPESFSAAEAVAQTANNFGELRDQDFLSENLAQVDEGIQEQQIDTEIEIPQETIDWSNDQAVA